MKKMISNFLLTILMKGYSSMRERIDEVTGERVFSGNAQTSIWKSPFLEIDLTYKPTVKNLKISVTFYTVSSEVTKFNIKTIEITNKKKTLVLQNQNKVCYTQKFNILTGSVAHTSSVKMLLTGEQFVELKEIIISPESVIRITNEYGTQYSNKIIHKGGIVKLFKYVK